MAQKYKNLLSYIDFSGLNIKSNDNRMKVLRYTGTVGEPDLELRGGDGFALLALRAFLPFVITFLFSPNKGGGVGLP